MTEFVRIPYLLKRTAFLLYFSLFYLTLSAQVTVDFTTSDSTGCDNLQVSFCDVSTSTAGNIVSWQWDLGGVNVGTKCPTRTFGTTGKYTICLHQPT